MRCSIWRRSSPRQYAPRRVQQLEVLEVRRCPGRCGPRQRSTNGPSVYVEMVSSAPRSSLSRSSLSGSSAKRRFASACDDFLAHERVVLLGHLRASPPRSPRGPRGERLRHLEVVVEAVLDRGTEADPRVGEEPRTAVARMCAAEWRSTSSARGSFSVRTTNFRRAGGAWTGPGPRRRRRRRCCRAAGACRSSRPPRAAGVPNGTVRVAPSGSTRVIISAAPRAAVRRVDHRSVNTSSIG